MVLRGAAWRRKGFPGQIPHRLSAVQPHSAISRVHPRLKLGDLAAPPRNV
jgi:hypothetical protein